MRVSKHPLNGSASATGLPAKTIRPPERRIALELSAVWRYRELLYFLVWRNYKIRYKQTVFGALWAILQPVTTMLVFSVFFGRLAGVPSDGVPYPLFTYAALVPWNYFANSVSYAANGLVSENNLIKKVYFPRLIIPLSSVISGLVDFGIAFAVLILMMAIAGMVPTWNVIFLPAFILLAIVTSLGLGLWLSPLNAKYRDVQFMVPFMLQLWLFITPVAYPSSLIPEPWRVLYGLNPMAGVVEGFRWALLGTDTRPGPMIFVSALAALVLLVSGAYYFRRMEETLADVL